eukprot:1437816-Prymnesium_polylepis.1
MGTSTAVPARHEPQAVGSDNPGIGRVPHTCRVHRQHAVLQFARTCQLDEIDFIPIWDRACVHFDAKHIDPHSVPADGGTEKPIPLCEMKFLPASVASLRRLCRSPEVGKRCPSD